jgi:hypothetical protein
VLAVGQPLGVGRIEVRATIAPLALVIEHHPLAGLHLANAAA